MINGAHAIVYSRDPEADRAFFNEFFGLPHIDAGEGWLIFGLPPTEIAFHPAETNDRHEIYLLCENIDAFSSVMQARGVEISPVENRGWGLISFLALPGGGRLGVYEPRHDRPPPAG